MSLFSTNRLVFIPFSNIVSKKNEKHFVSCLKVC